jgi:hypothetical protein
MDGNPASGPNFFGRSIYIPPQNFGPQATEGGVLLRAVWKLFKKDSLDASGPKFFGRSIYILPQNFGSQNDSKGRVGWKPSE